MDPQTPADEPARSWLSRVVEVRPHERAAVFWSAAYFFSLLFGYYILRALRDEMGIAGGVKNLSWLFMGTLTAVALTNPLFAALVSRYSRRRFIPFAYRFFQINLLLFLALFSLLPAGQQPVVARAFFIWTSVFNLLAVSIFWGFMADVFHSEQGKRLFGLIGLGGTLGAALGALLTNRLAVAIPHVYLLLISALFLEAAVQCMRALLRSVPDARPADAPGASPHGATADGAPLDPELAAGGVWAALARVATSPYLAGICICMLTYTITSTFLYFDQARIVQRAFADPGARTAFFARTDFYINVVTLGIQALATAKILRWVGVGWAQTVVPLVTFAGFLALQADPTPTVLLWFQVLRNTANYAVGKPAREVLFTVVPRADKYKAKSCIDTFVYRGGDAVGAGCYELCKWLGASIAAAAVPFLAIWIVVGLLLGRRHGRLAASQPRAAAGR